VTGRSPVTLGGNETNTGKSKTERRVKDQWLHTDGRKSSHQNWGKMSEGLEEWKSVKWTSLSLQLLTAWTGHLILELFASSLPLCPPLGSFSRTEQWKTHEVWEVRSALWPRKPEIQPAERGTKPAHGN
jgi:hypothetical protein